MIMSIFRRGKEPAEGLDYALSKNDHRGVERSVKPKVLWGSLEAVKAVVRAFRWAQNYVAGVFSFHPNDSPSEQDEDEIMRESLQVLLPGIDPNHVAFVFVRHEDKGYREIHFWVACTHLDTGKRLAPYYHPADRSRCRLWVQTVNDRYGYVDPNDPMHWRPMLLAPRNMPARYQTVTCQLRDRLEKMARAGSIASRRQIETVLTSAGWEISRRTRRFISVTHPGLKKPIRLAGRMFHADWTGHPSAANVEQLHREFARVRNARLRRSTLTLAGLLRKRQTYNWRRYGEGQSVETLIDSLTSALLDCSLSARTGRSYDFFLEQAGDVPAMLGDDEVEIHVPGVRL